MAHRIFTGSFAALEARWLEEIRNLQKDDPLQPVAVLVGSNLLASYLRARVVSQGRAAANLRFHTFPDLVRNLSGGSAGSMRKPRLPRLGASAVLESLLSFHCPEVFRPVSGYAGFRNALLDTFRDIRDSGVTPADLDEGVRRCLIEYPDREAHLTAFLSLYRMFRERAGQFHGADDDNRAAVSRASLATELLGSRRLLVYGIYDVTGLQSDLLASLSGVLDVVYFIPFVDDAVSAFARPFLSARERELRTPAEPLPDVSPAGSLGSLRRRLYGLGIPEAAGAARLAEDGSFSLVSAPGESRLAVEIVRELLRARHDGVIAEFHEAAVILRQPEIEVPLLAEAFRLRGIPCFVGGGTTFGSRPLARAILAIAGLEPESFSRRAILSAMEWLEAALPVEIAANWDTAEWRALTNSPRFLAGIPAWDRGTSGLVHELERELRRAGAGTSFEDGGDTESPPAPLVGRRLKAALNLREAWQQVKEAASGWPETAGWYSWARLLEERLGPLLSPVQEWSRFSTVLDEIGRLSEIAVRAGLSAEVSRGKISAALEDSLASLSHREGRFLHSGVSLVSAAAARGLRFPLVIIPGLEEGRFPARLRQDPILLDEERRRIGKPPRLPFKMLRGEEEKLLFDMAARSATRRLVLMTSRLDEASDRERIPSEFFLRAASAACGKPVSLRELAEGMVPGFRSVSLDNPAPRAGQVPVDGGEIRLRLITGSTARRAALSVLAGEEPHLLKKVLAYDEARRSARLTAYDGRLTDPALVRRIAGVVGPGAGPVSASRLEEYARCPYLFFLKRVIGLDAWEEQEPPLAIDPLERGRVMHEILERFLAGHAGNALSTMAPETLRASLASQANDSLENARPEGMHGLLWEIERERLALLLETWLEFETARAGTGLMPASLERPFGKFGPNENYPELRVKAGRFEFAFRGRIDRADVSLDKRRARVIDYKTGTLPKSMARRARPVLMAGEKMQIAIYRSALPLLEGLAEAVKITGEYLHLQPKDGAVISCAFDSDQLEEAAARLHRVLEVIGECIEDGIFLARTSGSVRPEGHCDRCEYLSICGKDRRQREERKARDPAALRFAKIAEIDTPLEGRE